MERKKKRILLYILSKRYDKSKKNINDYSRDIHSARD